MTAKEVLDELKTLGSESTKIAEFVVFSQGLFGQRHFFPLHTRRFRYRLPLTEERLEMSYGNHIDIVRGT